MNENTQVTLALIAILGTVIATLFKLLANNTKALNKSTEVHKQVALEIKKGNKEAKERNGHLAEMVKDSKKATLEAIKNLNHQEVHEQHVTHQVVDSQDKSE